jgi:hypothetical protein
MSDPNNPYPGGLKPKSTDIPLRPCPFCGSHAQLERVAQTHLYHVQCMGNANQQNGCGVQPCVESSSREDVAVAWNRREPDWERRYGELVETVAARTDQAKGEK